jgi:phosphoglycolate phosphatase
MFIKQTYESQYLLLFDLDGTLLDTAKQIEFSMNQIRTDFGYETLMPAEYVRLIGQPVDQLLLDLNLSFDEKEQLINQFRKHLRTEITRNGVECFDGVIDIFYLLESLGVSVAVATTKPSELAKHSVNHSRLRQFNIHIQGTDNFPPKLACRNKLNWNCCGSSQRKGFTFFRG